MAIIDLSTVTGLILKMGVERALDKAKRREAVIATLEKVGLNPGSPPPDFGAVYVYTLVEYGIGKCQPILDFFRHDFIRSAFRESFEKQDPAILNNEAGSLIEWHRVGEDLRRLDVDPRREFARFTAVFNEIVDRTRTPADVRRDQKLDDISGEVHQASTEILERLDKLGELAAIRAELARLTQSYEARRFVLSPSGSKLKVFISSTMSELRDVREIVAQALGERGIEAWVYEASAGAGPEGIIETSLRQVEAADIYVGLFWQRFGSVTVQEYRYARSLGKPSFVYIRDKDIQRESDLELFLKGEVYDLHQGVSYSYFGSALKLGEQVADDVMAWLVRSHREMTAQIKESRVSVDEISRLQAEVDRLQAASRDMLPAGTAADYLAQQLRGWFTAIGYRFESYVARGDRYFDWIINVPARRGYDRILVRGVEGEASLVDILTLRENVDRNKTDEGWLVAHRRVSQSARDQTELRENRDLYCYTLDELLDQSADFTGYLNWLEAEIKKKAIDRLYVPLACTKDEYDPATQQWIGSAVYDGNNGWIEGYIDRWLDDPSKEHISILGEFGMGKTWFALHYAWITLQRYREAKDRGLERPRLPLIIPLRDYAKAVSVESLFSEFFFRKHEIPLPGYSAFEQLNRMGKLLLIFDGFDEMAARVDRQKMIDNFWELARIVVPGAKVVLSCRTEHFPTAKEGRALLRAELQASTSKLTGEPPQFEILELQKLQTDQISQILLSRATEATVEKVMSDPELLDLCRRPLMTELVLEALPDVEAGKPVDVARIYLYAIRQKMERDIKAERTFTSMSDKLYFLCELSWEMLSTDQLSLNYRQFPDRLRTWFGPTVEAEADLDHWHYDMMGQTMLIRNADGDYAPAHRSLLEFFVAYKLAAELGGLAPDFVSLAQQRPITATEGEAQDYTWSQYFQAYIDPEGGRREFPPIRNFTAESIERIGNTFGSIDDGAMQWGRGPIVEMMRSMVTRDALWRAIWSTRDTTPDVSKRVGANAVAVLRSMTEPFSGTDLSRTVLDSANFGVVLPYDPWKEDLSSVNLSHANLKDVSFAFFNLEGANLTGVRLDPGSLRGANLLNAIGLTRSSFPCASEWTPEVPSASGFLTRNQNEVYAFAVGQTEANVLVITGQSGVGKTTLVAAIAQKLMEQDQAPPVYWHNYNYTRVYVPSRGRRKVYKEPPERLLDKPLLLELATFLAIGGQEQLLEFVSHEFRSRSEDKMADYDIVRIGISIAMSILRTQQYVLFIDDPFPIEEWSALRLMLEEFAREPTQSKLIITGRSTAELDLDSLTAQVLYLDLSAPLPPESEHQKVADVS